MMNDIIFIVIGVTLVVGIVWALVFPVIGFFNDFKGSKYIIPGVIVLEIAGIIVAFFIVKFYFI